MSRTLIGRECNWYRRWYSRGAVLASLIPKLTPGAVVLMHDYIGREHWYNWAVQLYTVESISGTMIKLRV